MGTKVGELQPWTSAEHARRYLETKWGAARFFSIRRRVEMMVFEQVDGPLAAARRRRLGEELRARLRSMHLEAKRTYELLAELTKLASEPLIDLPVREEVPDPTAASDEPPVLADLRLWFHYGWDLDGTPPASHPALEEARRVTERQREGARELEVLLAPYLAELCDSRVLHHSSACFAFDSCPDRAEPPPLPDADVSEEERHSLRLAALAAELRRWCAQEQRRDPAFQVTGTDAAHLAIALGLEEPLPGDVKVGLDAEATRRRKAWESRLAPPSKKRVTQLERLRARLPPGSLGRYARGLPLPYDAAPPRAGTESWCVRGVPESVRAKAKAWFGWTDDDTEHVT